MPADPMASPAPRVDEAAGADELSASIDKRLPLLVAQVYDQCDLSTRARLLECLIRPLGPLGLVAVASGAFGGFLRRPSWQQLSVTVEEALRFSAEQVLDLTSFVVQCQPEALGQVGALIAERQGSLPALSVSLLLLALHARLRRPAAPPS